MTRGRQGRASGGAGPAGATAAGGPESARGRPFLGIYYATCQVYGRLYRNPEGTAYTGRCPRCGAQARAAIGHGGTSRRLFTAYCQ